MKFIRKQFLACQFTRERSTKAKMLIIVENRKLRDDVEMLKSQRDQLWNEVGVTLTLPYSMSIFLIFSIISLLAREQ
jgi:hypothetical protein